MPRAIVHLDADAFFASVEQAADARLRGKPIAVGGEKRGIIASASYEARKFGIETAMPTARARKLCPKLILLPGDFEKYERFSNWMFSYAYDFTPEVEISSIDEGYFDLSGARKSPIEIAQTIRRAIGDALKITVSEGIASNKLISQIASKIDKPAAFHPVPPGGEISFLHPLANTWLPGVGPKTAIKLHAAGLAKIGQIAITSTELLGLLVGSAALQLKNFANGIDERPVVPAREPAKSYSQQETFEVDQTDEEFMEAVLRRMADHLMAKVRADQKSIRTVTVKIRYNDMDTDQCGETLSEPTDLETDVYAHLRPLFRQAWRRRVSLRLVSLKLSNIYDGFSRVELPLNASVREHEARRRLAASIDELRRAHGPRAVFRGHDFTLSKRSGRKEAAEVRSVALPLYGLRTVEGCHRQIRRAHPYVPLHVHSYYSFLNSTLSIQNIIQLAQEYGAPAIALTDQENLHGAVEFVQAATAAGIKPILGAEIQAEGQSLRLYVENATGYANLCRLLSQPTAFIDSVISPQCRVGFKVQSPKSNAQSPKSKVQEIFTPHAALRTPHSFDGLLAVSSDPQFAPFFPNRFYLEISSAQALRKVDGSTSLPLVAALPVHYSGKADRWKFDVVQSIRTRTLLRQEHPDKQLTGDFHFSSPAEIRELFHSRPDLLHRTGEIADRCSFEFPFGKPQFPAFPPPEGFTPGAFLQKLVLEGLSQRYPHRAAELTKQIQEELAIISDVGYEEYFLVVWDILQECRRRGIEWITRGSAADSLVCYCLRISDVCPIRFDLYFRRFLNKDRMQLNKLPDIDIDFPHDRKDEVIDLIFARYGLSQTAVVGGFSTYQARSALGDVAKVLGVSEYQIRRVTERLPHFANAGCITEAAAATEECRDLPLHEEPYHTALQMAQFLDGFPRHPKMHPCGVVISRQPLDNLVPCFVSNKGYPTTHFDMDAVEAIGLVKMDILAQGGLAVMRDVRAMLEQRGIQVDLNTFTAVASPLQNNV